MNRRILIDLDNLTVSCVPDYKQIGIVTRIESNLGHVDASTVELGKAIHTNTPEELDLTLHLDSNWRKLK